MLVIYDRSQDYNHINYLQGKKDPKQNAPNSIPIEMDDSESKDNVDMVVENDQGVVEPPPRLMITKMVSFIARGVFAIPKKTSDHSETEIAHRRSCPCLQRSDRP